MPVGAGVGMGHISPGRVGPGATVTGGLVGDGVLPLGDRGVVRFRSIDCSLVVTHTDLNGHLGRPGAALRLHRLTRDKREPQGQQHTRGKGGDREPVLGYYFGGADDRIRYIGGVSAGLPSATKFGLLPSHAATSPTPLPNPRINWRICKVEISTARVVGSSSPGDGPA